ncbi:MAG: DNA-directed RNA polymerase [Candidatus Bathyarchaeia archaeon]
MFRTIRLEDTIRIPPEKFGLDLAKAAEEQLRHRYEGIMDEELGYVLKVIDVDVDPIGRIVAGDGATYHRATFTLLTFYPVLQEVVEGEVVEVQDFGVFVRIGPVDALLHVSQILDDYVTYDEKQGALLGKQTHRLLRKGDIMRVRIAAVSLSGGGTGKIGATARQPFLGKLEWINEDVMKARGAEAKAQAQEAAK